MGGGGQAGREWAGGRGVDRQEGGGWVGGEWGGVGEKPKAGNTIHSETNSSTALCPQ